MGIFNQVLATGIICYLCTTMGVLWTWPSFTIKLFSSSNTTLDRVMTDTEISLLGSVSSISSIIITPFSGYLMDTLGRKWSCVVFYLFMLIGWVLVVVWNKVELVLFSMFLSGLSSAMILVIPIYIGEFCDQSIRGTMTSSFLVFFGIGTLLSYLFGGLLEYHVMNYVGLTMTVLGLVVFSYVKESPLFLMQKEREKEAARSIAFYKSEKITSKEVFQEIENIRRLLNPNIDDVTPSEEKKLNPGQEGPKQKMSPWRCLMQYALLTSSAPLTFLDKQLTEPQPNATHTTQCIFHRPKCVGGTGFEACLFALKSGSSRRALLLSTTLFTSSVFQGLIVVQVYAQTLFEQAVPSLSAMVSSVLFAIVSITSGFIGAYLVDAIGRRPLMMYGSLATCISCVALGSQIHLAWGPSWLTAVFIYVYCLCYVVGPGSVPYVINAEIFLPEVKSFASMVAMEWTFACYFVILFIFNPLVNTVGLGPVFYLFAAICLLTAVYCYYYLPETRGLPVDELQQRFMKRANLK